MVNTVIIGAGDIARKRHIPAVQQADSGTLYGFCNRTWTTTRIQAERYHAHAYHSAEEVFADPQVQAVLISTPPAAHAELAVQALEAGKYVLLEKPMALTVPEAERIVEAEARSAARVTMLHVQRYYAPHARAKELLDRGEIGRLLTVRTYLGNADTGLLAGEPHPGWEDALFNVGVHRLDLLRWLVGAEARRVFCHRSRLLVKPADPEDPKTVDDHTVGIFEFENGVVGTMIASRTSFHGEDRSTVLIGTEGTITTYARGHELIVEKRNGEKSAYEFPGAHVQGVWELTDLHERFFRSILDRTEPEVTALDGLRSVQLAAALERSDREGRWVWLADPQADAGLSPE